MMTSFHRRIRIGIIDARNKFGVDAVCLEQTKAAMDEVCDHPVDPGRLEAALYAMEANGYVEHRTVQLPDMQMIFWNQDD